MATCSAPLPYSESVSTCVTEKVSGSHRFKIIGYSLTKGIGIGKSIKSGTFTVGGYDWAIYYYPDGSELEGNAAYISFFLELLTEGAEVRAIFDLALLDQSGKPSPAFSHSNTAQTFSKCVGMGWPFDKFIKRCELEASQCLKDDCFTVKCTISIIKPHHVSSSSPAFGALPSDLHQHFVQLLENGEGADVTFEVGRETFAAHRCVLAARSSVFRAELFGTMKEKSMQCIKIKDVEAVVFKTLLYFVYSDTLPADIEDLAEGSSTFLAQHLLAAADRFGLEKLKLICEDKLSEDMSINTVATTLALAEQHHCRKLKAVCLEFIFSPKVLVYVMQTDGFQHLQASCPLVLKELLEKLSNE